MRMIYVVTWMAGPDIWAYEVERETAVFWVTTCGAKIRKTVNNHPNRNIFWSKEGALAVLEKRVEAEAAQNKERVEQLRAELPSESK